MINYPEILKKFDDEPRLRSIGEDLRKKGFILKGKKISSEEMFAINSDKEAITLTETELKDKQKEQIDYLYSHVNTSIKDHTKINNIMLGASLLMIATSILVKVPLFGLAFTYFGGIALKDNLQVNKIKKQINNDKWFSDNEQEVSQKLNRDSKLYRKLSSNSKVILIRDGKITLNNIDEFPKNDLRLVRRNISRQIKKEEKNKIKQLSR